MHACVLSRFSRFWLFVTLWTIACQAPLSMGVSRQENWSELSCPPPGDLPNQGSKSDLLHCRQILYCWATRETLILILNSMKRGSKLIYSTFNKFHLVQNSCPETVMKFKRSRDDGSPWGIWSLVEASIKVSPFRAETGYFINEPKAVTINVTKILWTESFCWIVLFNNWSSCVFQCGQNIGRSYP